MHNLLLGLVFIFVAAVAGGAFGLQYRVMRRYTVENSSLLSMLFATVIVPLVAIEFILPGWTDAISAVGFKANLLVYVLGFGWGMGAITYAYGFNILGMALAASMLKGISIGIGSGIPLIRHWNEVPYNAKMVTVTGLLLLLVGTAISGVAGARRGKEMQAEKDKKEEQPPPESKGTAVTNATGKLFWVGMLSCLVSGVFSACANLGYEFADPLQAAMKLGADDWRATLIRWMPMYWGGISALLLFMGGTMIKTGTWRNYIAPGSGRDFVISSSMGGVHFLAQIPYGIGAFYLGTLGTTVGFGVNIGMALIVAASLGFWTGEWRTASTKAVRTLLAGIIVLLISIGILAYANSLALPGK